MMTMHIVRCLILICLFVLRVHAKPDSSMGALTIVQQDVDDNGVTLENENGDSEIVDEKYEPFHPTREWQTVKQGQAIPAGLHVRMNFETGEKEARLMDGATEEKEKRLSDEEAEYKYWRDGERQGMMNMDRKQFSMNELKKALKDFKTTQLEDTDLQREAEVKKKFKSYEELRQDFIDMNMDIKTDGEIIEELLTKMKHADIPRDDLLTVLKDLEYYLHQIDNGVLFKDLGGIPYILNIVNNSADEVLQIEAALVLGAAMSSNPKVQIGALEAGALPLLLRVISVNSSLPLQRRLIYCLSTLCRHFPYAQIQFLESGGLAALSNVFDVFESGMEMKVKVKIVSLLNDLLMEKTLTLDNANEDITTDTEKLKQYKQLYLLEALVKQGWCERITKLLKWLHINTISDHDEVEHVLNTMLTLSASTSSVSCKQVFINSLTDLQNVQSGYRTLSQQHDDDADDYFMNIVNVISNIIRNISLKDEL